NEKQYRKRELVESRNARGRFRIEQRDLVLVLEQFYGEFPGPELEQAGIEEYCADSNPHCELDDGEREFSEPSPCSHEQGAKHRPRLPPYLMHGGHVGAPSLCLMETASPSDISFRKERPLSKPGSVSMASSA